jgi:hypothetical protein
VARVGRIAPLAKHRKLKEEEEGSVCLSDVDRTIIVIMFSNNRTKAAVHKKRFIPSKNIFMPLFFLILRTTRGL